MTDEQKQADTALEVHVCGLGFKWGGDVWEIEDANLHPAIRAIEAAATEPLLDRIAALEAKLAQRVPPDSVSKELIRLADIMRDCGRLKSSTGSAENTIRTAASLLSAAPAAHEQQKDCWCEACDLAQGHPMGRTRMSVCPQCGDKRCPRAKHHDSACQAPNAQQAESALKPMTARRAAYFMQRFRNEEKLLGPNEQAALKFTIEALEAMEAQQAEAQEPVATINISDDDFNLGLTDDYAFGVKRLPNGKHPLFTRPQPAQLQALSEEEVDAVHGEYIRKMMLSSRIFAADIQSALAAKNGVNLK